MSLYQLFNPLEYLRIIGKVFQFIKKPIYQKSEDRFGRIMQVLLTIFIFGFILKVGAMIFQGLLEGYGWLEIKRTTGRWRDTLAPLTLFILGAFLAPIFEELACRLYLHTTRRNISISAGLMSAYFLSYPVFDSWILNWEDEFGLKIIFTLGLIAAIYGGLSFIGDKRLEQQSYSPNFRWIYYFSAIFFGFLHISNFVMTPAAIAFIGVLTLPQIIGGLFSGFARVKYGLWASILLHILNNSIAFLPSLLKAL